jgi:hypothetical protein
MQNPLATIKNKNYLGLINNNYKMGLHEELLRQLLNAIEEGKKLNQIKDLTDELKNVCENLDKEKDILIAKIKKDEDLSSEEKARTQALNDRYNNTMNKLRELVMKK